MTKMADDLRSGKIKLPENDTMPDFTSEFESKPKKTMSEKQYSDDSPNGNVISFIPNSL